MIKYKLDVQEELKKKGYPSYIIRKKQVFKRGNTCKDKARRTNKYEKP